MLSSCKQHSSAAVVNAGLRSAHQSAGSLSVETGFRCTKSSKTIYKYSSNVQVLFYLIVKTILQGSKQGRLCLFAIIKVCYKELKYFIFSTATI